jgi:hypothetical protein
MWVDINVSKQHVASTFPEDVGSIAVQSLCTHVEHFRLSQLRIATSEMIATLWFMTYKPRPLSHATSRTFSARGIPRTALSQL